ncbi:helix-turn-helix transcriptional regulator [Pseudomonas sp. XS1P51]
MSTTTIYEMANAGLFPRQVKLGGRAVAWVKSDVLAWSKDKIEKAKK